MGTIVVFENVTLDGVTQDPTAEEGFTSDNWLTALPPADREAWAKMVLDDALGAEALLLGRGGYEYFGSRYPSRTSALADVMNRLPKYVVSTTLTDPQWHNSTVIGLADVSALRQRIDGEIRVYASSRLVRTLIKEDLVDELRLAVFPLLMGAGDRLLDQTDAPRPVRPWPLRLVEARTVGDNLTHLTYRRDR
jgi:dihydrofolate reductase